VRKLVISRFLDLFVSVSAFLDVLFDKVGRQEDVEGEKKTLPCFLRGWLPLTLNHSEVRSASLNEAI